MNKKILTLTILALTMFLGITPSVYASLVLTDWTNATSSSANGFLGDVSVTFSASSNTIYPTYVIENFSGYSNSTIYTPAIANSEAIGFRGDKGTGGYNYTIKFDSPVKNPVIYIASLASTLRFEQDISLKKISGEDVFRVDKNIVSGITDDTKYPPNNDANGIFQVNGIVTEFSFNAVWDMPSASSDDGIMMQIGIDVMPSPVPIPGAIWLLGSCLAGLIGLKYKKKTLKSA